MKKERLATELSEMLAYVDKLNQLDTGNVEPTAQVGESGTPMRDDAVTNAGAGGDARQRARAQGELLQGAEDNRVRCAESVSKVRVSPRTIRRCEPG